MLKFHDFEANIKNENFPLLAITERLPAFQIVRLKNEKEITEFKLINCSIEIDLSADKLQIKKYEYDFIDEYFNIISKEQLIYYANEDLLTSVKEGKYIVKVSDGENTKYSDWIKIAGTIADIPNYGEFSTAFSNAFNIGTS